MRAWLEGNGEDPSGKTRASHGAKITLSSARQPLAGLAPEQPDEGRDLAVTTDFRSVFAEVATRHMDARRLDSVLPGYAAPDSTWLGALRA